VPRGWESWLRYRGQKDGYGAAADLTRAFYFYLDSESLAINPTIKENTAKIVKGRAIVEEARSIQQQEPGGQFTFQPRSDDILGILAAHFQCYRSTENATSIYWFNPVAEQPDWSGTLVTGGDPNDGGGPGTGTYNDGETTDTCCFVLEQYYGKVTDGSNGRRFVDCVVSDIEFSAAVGEELQCTPTVKAGSFALCDFDAVTDAPPCDIGSLSDRGAFRYYEGTVTVAGAQYDVNSFRLTCSNNMDSKLVLGKQNPASYPFGRYVASGEFELEFGYGSFVHQFLAENDGIVNLTFKRAAETLTITLPLVRYNEPTANVSSGEDLINQTVPFVAYGRADNANAPPIEVMVITTDPELTGTVFWPLPAP